MYDAMDADVSGQWQLAFVRSLEADLSALGLSLDALPDLSTLPTPQTDFQGRRLREQNNEWVVQLASMDERDASGRVVSASRLQPELHFCNSAADNRLYESLRLMQQVPSGRRLGRQVRVLVYDSSQASSTLVGAIGLASPLYRLGCRDRYLGWGGSARLAVRHFGLRRTMDLAVCVNTPVFAGMRITKLLAMLAVSSPVAERYASRYGEPLLAVVTTCATGAHCACFNRIMIRPGGLFKKVGETAGHTTSHFSNSTIRAARQFVLGTNMTSDVMQSSAEALPVLRTAMKKLKLPHERLLRMGVHKAVYIAGCYPGALAALRDADPTTSGAYLTVSDAVEFWRTRVIRRGPSSGPLV